MIPVVKRESREVDIHLIDDPEFLMRETFDDDDFRDLQENIQANGIQVSLIVERRGDRFRLAAGFRRLTAARALGARTVPCDIREPGELDEEAIKILENDVREQVNAAEAGVYLMRLFETRAEHDTDKLCAIVRRSRSYVEDRLLLVSGDADVLRAVKQRRISFSVSQELNRVKNVGYRRLFLENAINGNASAKVVRQWRQQNEILEGVQPPRPAPAAGETAIAVDEPPSHLACLVCRLVENTNRLKLVYLHDYCELAVLEKALAPFRSSMVGGTDA